MLLLPPTAGNRYGVGSVGWRSSESERIVMPRAWKPHSTARARTAPAAGDRYVYLSSEPVISFVQPSWSSVAAPESIASRPTRSAMYMYQRRSVAEAPSSRTAARSLAAVQKWKAKTTARTRIAQPSWEVVSQLVGWLFRKGCSSCVMRKPSVYIAGTDATRHAQSR